MKKLLIFTVLLLAVFSLSVRGDYVTTTHYFHVAGAVIDTAAGGGELAPDSVRILVNFNGSEIFDAWYNTGDAQCATGEANDIIFHDQYGDIDNDQGDGCYYIRSQFYHADTDLWHKTDHYFMLGNQSVNTIQISSSTDAADSAELVFEGSRLNNVVTSTNLTTNNDKTGYALSAASLSAMAESLWVIRSTRTITGDTYTPDVNVASVDADAIEVGDLDAPVYLAIADTNWDEVLTGATHNVATSAGRRLRQLETGQILLTGTINTANDSTATLDLSGAYDDDFFVHTWLVVTVGIDSVQIRSINGYTGATDSVDMAPGESWVVVPSNGDDWEIVANASVNVADLHQTVLDEIWEDSRPDTLLSPYRAGGFNGNYVLNGGLFLDSLWVVNTAGNAVYFTATSGRALYAYSSGGGDAVRFTSAGGSGHGLSLVASSGNGLNAVSSSGNEIDADIVGDITGNVSGFVDSVLKAVKLGNIESGTIDSSSVDLNLFYKFLAYDDSTAIDLDNELSEWLQNNLAGGAAALPDSVVARIDSILVSLGYDATDLHTKVDNLSLSGGGTEPETLIVLASADSTQLQGVRVTIRTIDQSTVKVDGLTTDVNGKLILDLDADSFFVALSANNYIQKNDTIVVAGGGQTDTLFMQAFDPGSPSSADLCIVYGWVYDIHGDSVKGAEVTVEILSDSSEVGITSGGVWINLYSYKRKTETDATGKFSLEVYKTSALSDTSSTYLFSIKQASGRVVRVLSDVPDSSTFKLTK